MEGVNYETEAIPIGYRPYVRWFEALKRNKLAPSEVKPPARYYITPT